MYREKKGPERENCYLSCCLSRVHGPTINQKQQPALEYCLQATRRNNGTRKNRIKRETMRKVTQPDIRLITMMRKRRRQKTYEGKILLTKKSYSKSTFLCRCSCDLFFR